MTKLEQRELTLTVNRCSTEVRELYRLMELLLTGIFARRPGVKDELLERLDTERPYDGDAAKVNSNVRAWLTGI